MADTAPKRQVHWVVKVLVIWHLIAIISYSLPETPPQFRFDKESRSIKQASNYVLLMALFLVVTSLSVLYMTTSMATHSISSAMKLQKLLALCFQHLGVKMTCGMLL